MGLEIEVAQSGWAIERGPLSLCDEGDNLQSSKRNDRATLNSPAGDVQRHGDRCAAWEYALAGSSFRGKEGVSGG
jgi:hypothetical protein